MQLRQKWIGRSELEGKFIVWFHATWMPKKDTGHHWCIFIVICSSFHTMTHTYTHSLDNVSSVAFSFGGWKAGWLISQSVYSEWIITHLNPSASGLLSKKVETPLSSQWFTFLHPGPKNLSLISVCQRAPCRPELHVLPGNIRSLNIVSGRISDYRHTAAPPGMFSVQLAAKCW